MALVFSRLPLTEPEPRCQPRRSPRSLVSPCVLAAGRRAIPEERARFPSVGPDQTSAAAGAAALRVFLPQWQLGIRGSRHAPARGTAGKCQLHVKTNASHQLMTVVYFHMTKTMRCKAHYFRCYCNFLIDSSRPSMERS